MHLLTQAGWQFTRRSLTQHGRCWLVMAVGGALLALVYDWLPVQPPPVQAAGLRRAIYLPVWAPTWPVARLRLREHHTLPSGLEPSHGRTCLRFGQWHADLPVPPGAFLAAVLVGLLAGARHCWPWQWRRRVLLAAALLWYYWPVSLLVSSVVDGTEQRLPEMWTFTPEDWFRFIALMVPVVAYGAYLVDEVLLAFLGQAGRFCRSVQVQREGTRPEGTENA